MDVIKCERVSQFVGANKVLDGLDLVVKQGECCALLGLDRLSRTMLLSLLRGHERPSSGRLWVYGEEPTLIFPARLGYAPMQLPFSLLSLHELFFLKAGATYPVSRRWLERLVSFFELSSVLRVSWSALSPEVQYKALFVLSLLHDPSLWLIDMILDHLSETLLDRFRHCLSGLLSPEMTVIFTTQQLALACAFAKNVCVFHKGRLLFYGTVSSLTHRFGDYRLSLPMPSAVVCPHCVAVCVYEGCRHLFVARHMLHESLLHIQAAGIAPTAIAVSEIAVRDIVFQVLLRDRKEWDVF